MERRHFLALLPSIIGAHPISARAQGSPELLKTITVLTVTEAALSFAALVNAQVKSIRPDDYLKWQCKYNNRAWQLRFDGMANKNHIKVTMVGHVWGDEAQDLLVTYTGSGQLGKEPVLVHGKVDWPYDRERKDYLTTDFRHLTKFGENSAWGWVTGAEILVGGVVGAGGAIAITAAPTGGLALGAAAFIGSAGAIGGAQGLVSLSETVKKLTESSEPVAAPGPPPRPKQPPKDETVQPQDGRILVAMSRDGKLQGSGPDASIRVTGSFDNKSGAASGAIVRAEKK